MDPREEFSLALHYAARDWRVALERRLKKSGLSISGWLAVAAIVRSANPMSQTELANHLGLQTATMVPMLDRLRAAGLIDRKPSETDRRINYIVPTDAGREMYAKIKKEASILRKELLQPIDPAMLDITRAVLEQIQQIAKEL